MKFFIVVFFTINLYATTYIGTGTGKTQSEAKQNALKDISSQIFVKIDSSTTRTQLSNGNKYKKSIKIKSTQQTNASFNGYKLLEMNFKDSLYFVKISYENIPSLDKFVNKINSSIHSKAGARERDVIISSIRKDFGKSLGIELVRKDKKWYIKYQDIMQILDTKNFHKFFTTIPNKNLTITTNKKNNILYDGDEFYFKIKSTKKGYITIFTVYEDGTASTLLQNIPIGKNSLENIPDDDFEAVPFAGLIEKGVETFDMYVAIYSSKKMILDNYARADENKIDDERYKNFDELIEFIKDKTYTTLKVVTKPR